MDSCQKSWIRANPLGKLQEHEVCHHFLTDHFSYQRENDCLYDPESERMILFAATESYVSESACFTSQLLKCSEILLLGCGKVLDLTHIW